MMARRFAILSVPAGRLNESLAGDRVAAAGDVVRDGVLVDAVAALPPQSGTVCVCRDTGHVFSRELYDRDHHGTIVDLLGYPGVAQGFVRKASQNLVLTPGDRESAKLCLARTLPLGQQRIAEVIEEGSPIAMTRERLVGLLLASLAHVGEENEAGRRID